MGEIRTMPSGYGTQALYGHYPNIKSHQSLTLRLAWHSLRWFHCNWKVHGLRMLRPSAWRKLIIWDIYIGIGNIARNTGHICIGRSPAIGGSSGCTFHAAPWGGNWYKCIHKPPLGALSGGLWIHSGQHGKHVQRSTCPHNTHCVSCISVCYTFYFCFLCPSRTALHWAAKRGHASTVSMLLQYGADKQVETTKGETALQLAQDPTIRSSLGGLYRRLTHIMPPKLA